MNAKIEKSKVNSFILNKMSELDLPILELNRYNESHRFYHNLEHIESMIFDAINQNILTDELFMAIVFHDIIYNPKESNNEELSAELFYKYVQNENVKQAILETKNHVPTTELSKQLCRLDTKVLYSDYETFIDFEHKIFKEYQWVDYSIYKEKRLEILSAFGVNPERLNYVENRKPKIAVYAGSFNPFHKGHFNILTKAEQIFDKVIIARGVNPEKNHEVVELPKEIQFRQIDNYKGLLTDYIDNLGYDVTLIRGLRNSFDFQYEMTQYRFLQDLSPNLKVVFLPCDKEYEHLSSSALRFIKQFNRDKNYLL